MTDYEKATQMADASDFWYQLVTTILNENILEKQYENKEGFTIVKKQGKKLVYEGNITISLPPEFLGWKGTFLASSEYIRTPEWIAFQLETNNYGFTDDHFEFDDKVYLLCGIIHYVGKCHYYCDIKLEGYWWRLNDNSDPIQYASFNQIEQRTIYMLVYTSKPETMQKNITW